MPEICTKAFDISFLRLGNQFIAYQKISPKKNMQLQLSLSPTYYSEHALTRQYIILLHVQHKICAF